CLYRIEPPCCWLELSPYDVGMRPSLACVLTTPDTGTNQLQPHHSTRHKTPLGHLSDPTAGPGCWGVCVCVCACMCACVRVVCVCVCARAVCVVCVCVRVCVCVWWGCVREVSQSD